MEHQFLHLIIAPLVLQPKYELTANEHSMYIRFLCPQPTSFTNGLFTLVKFVNETVGVSSTAVLALATLGSAT